MAQSISLHQTLDIGEEKSILVKFVAPHCSGCVTIKPLLEQLTREQSEVLHLVEIDITEEPELAMELDVRSVPTVALFKQEQELGRLVGLQPKKHYANLVQQAV
ncbi:thioredoxin family protein [Microseira wollei]|uniref:Thioredoxin n=1 Tax=Microseira wollei NIES-4236 TaxID=2530354 RepID=A0AAV3XI52_9CYAN|nr:thioredoxin family protein [Microseira wollei]GET40406.1 thioredoxin [Microseira wollei NIES-4236]